MMKTLEPIAPASELALLGGPPLFDAPQHVGRPNLGDRQAFLGRLAELLDRRWLTNDGPFVQELEARAAARLQVPHVVAICNGTVALEIAVRAVGLHGEVILPAFTFVATAHALAWQGIHPVFADVDPLTHNVDPREVEALVTPRTTGILAVHLWGRPCAVEPLTEIARRHGLALLFDAAHAFGCTDRGRPVGGAGRCEVFSLHATKVLNSGEGGLIATRDAELAGRLRFTRNFGFSGYDRVDALGTNGKMSELAAALGLTNLEALDQFAAANRRNHEAYARELGSVPGARLIEYDGREVSTRPYAVVEWDERAAGLSRDDLVETLHAENVLARRYFFPGCHRMEPYRSSPGHVRRPLPNTEALARRVLVLPTGSTVDAGVVAGVCRIVRTAVAHADAVRRRLAERGRAVT
jgi:dTDP-4-amino-4,6-dideoxygalactose transaminase